MPVIRIFKGLSVVQISVIIPVYNAEPYLPECLDSVLKQTYQNFEIICVNDGSADNSLAVLKEYASLDKRIKVLSQKNQGQSVARNKGLDEAKGKYILFLDSDDFLHPQTLQAARYWAQKNKTPLTAFLYDREEKIGEFKKTGFETYNIKHLPNLIRTDLMPYTDKNARPRFHRVVTTMLFNRNLFKNLRFKEGIYYEDTYLLFSLLKNNIRTTLLPIPFYKYRLNPKSTVNGGFTEKHLNSYRVLLEDIMEQYTDDAYQTKREFIKRTLIAPICQKALQQLAALPVKRQKSLLYPLHKMIFEMSQKEAITIEENQRFKISLHKMVYRIKKNILHERKVKEMKNIHNRSRKITSKQAKSLRLRSLKKEHNI